MRKSSAYLLAQRGILTIYRSFRELWSNIKTSTQSTARTFFDTGQGRETILKTCQGWIARYEIHQIGNETTSKLVWCIALDQNEVFLQLRQSLRLSALGFWKLAFPLSISKDLTVLTVLRKVFIFEISIAREPGNNTTNFAPSTQLFEKHNA
jgi:hypothetical protein